MTVFGEDPLILVQKGMLKPDDRRRVEIPAGSGRSRAALSATGQYVRSRIPARITPDIALDATIRAAAPYQVKRSGDTAIRIAPADIREKVRERKVGNLILFIVDASGSMGVERRMSAVKGAILSLLTEAYQNRDRVGLVVFRGRSAEVLMEPTASVERARSVLSGIPTGGKTPLAGGLSCGLSLLMRERLRDRDILPYLVLISDGKGNIALSGGDPRAEALEIAGTIREKDIPALVIDTERGLISFGLAKELAGRLGARYVRLDEITADGISQLIRPSVPVRP